MALIVNKTIHLHDNIDMFSDGTSGLNFSILGDYDKSIYRVFSIISVQQPLEQPVNTRTEIDLFIQYAELLTVNQQVPVGFTELNNYFGSLGV